jgi:hypothetical protein
MAEYKPLGSEKLQGDDKLRRILELTYYGNNKKTSTSTKAELVKESISGGVYGIVKEKDGYYVKRGLNESSLDYIGGMFMKNKNKFSSYAEAFKRLELIKGQEELNEATKYVLKQKPSMETEAAPMPAAEPAPAPMPAPAPAPAPETAAMPTDEPPAPVPPSDEPPAPGALEPSPEGGDENDGMRSSYMEEIQKFAGKLGQELRDQHERLESDDIKYVLNMIISAVSLDKLSDEDIEDLGKKFEREEEVGAEAPTGEEPAMEPAPEEAPAPEAELGEEAMSKLDEFINSPNLGEVDLNQYSLGEEDETIDYSHDSEDGALSDKDLGWADDGLGHGGMGDDQQDIDELVLMLKKPKDYVDNGEPGLKDHGLDLSREKGFASYAPDDHESDYETMDNEAPSVHELGEEEEADGEKEIDLDEIKRQISQAIGDTLSKHFN